MRSHSEITAIMINLDPNFEYHCFEMRGFKGSLTLGDHANTI